MLAPTESDSTERKVVGSDLKGRVEMVLGCLGFCFSWGGLTAQFGDGLIYGEVSMILLDCCPYR